jgi:mannose-6-phosphate isomerase class I
MANSDHVLRCGLTPKHVNVPELLRVTPTSPSCPARDGLLTAIAGDGVVFVAGAGVA